MSKATPLPIAPEQVTAEWFSSILGRKVTSVDTRESTLQATTSKLLMTLHYDDLDEAQAEAAGLPVHICVKAGLNQAIVNSLPPGLIVTMYVTETMWFREVAPTIKPPVEIPRCYWTGVDATNGIIIMDDLKHLGCTFGDATKTYSKDWIRSLLEQVAGIHAVTWGATAEDYKEWLKPDSYPNTILGLMGLWDQLILDPSRPPLPDSFKDKARIERILKKHWFNVDPKTRVLLHGDTHAGNTYIKPDGQPRLLDMQCVMIGSALWDVSYLIAGASTVAERRRDEMEHLDWYLACLAKAGGPTLARDEVMTEYKRGFLFGWGWLLTPEGWQSRERVHAMAERHVAALQDHGVHEMVEAMEV